MPLPSRYSPLSSNEPSPSGVACSLFEVTCKQRHVIGVDLRQLGQLFRQVIVM